MRTSPPRGSPATAWLSGSSRTSARPARRSWDGPSTTTPGSASSTPPPPGRRRYAHGRRVPSGEEVDMALGYDGKLFILAFDHRGSFQKKFFGITSEPTPEEAARISDAKMLIFEGFLPAVDGGARKDAAGILVDEQFGAEIARRARKDGFNLAMPVEKSGQDEFDFQYGDDFGAHIEEFDPTFSKVLVRYNPEGDREMNATQLVKLEQLSTWLHERDRKFLFELLVPGEPAQLEAVGGDEDRFDKELRPALMLQAIRDCHERGVEPDIWKIEGLDKREDWQANAELTRSAGRDNVACVV